MDLITDLGRICTHAIVFLSGVVEAVPGNKTDKATFEHLLLPRPNLTANARIWRNKCNLFCYGGRSALSMLFRILIQIPLSRLLYILFMSMNRFRNDVWHPQIRVYLIYLDLPSKYFGKITITGIWNLWP